jgi:hypothetical protein
MLRCMLDLTPPVMCLERDYSLSTPNAKTQTASSTKQQQEKENEGLSIRIEVTGNLNNA